jgi:hypothetical protein
LYKRGPQQLGHGAVHDHEALAELLLGEHHLGEQMPASPTMERPGSTISSSPY